MVEISADKVNTKIHMSNKIHYFLYLQGHSNSVAKYQVQKG